LVIALPFVALLPDLTFMLMQRIYFPTPTDAVMHKQATNPKYVYNGFKDYDGDEVIIENDKSS
jgi:hypothetical protein